MNKTLENRDIEQDAVIEYLKPKKLIISDGDELLECPCAKNNIKPITNYDKITESVESLAEFIETISVKDVSKERIVEWLLESDEINPVCVSCGKHPREEGELICYECKKHTTNK